LASVAARIYTKWIGVFAIIRAIRVSIGLFIAEFLENEIAAQKNFHAAIVTNEEVEIMCNAR